MQRTIEKLTQERKKKEQEFFSRLDELKTKSQELESQLGSLKLQSLFSRLEELINHSSSQDSLQDRAQSQVNHQIFLVFKEFQNLFSQNWEGTHDLLSGLTDVIQLGSGLIDVKDREWDALGSNHTGMIFKSMEWRVDRLAAAYEDVNLLIKKFLHLKEQLNRLLSVLNEKKMPAGAQIREISDPIEDWTYAAFENRYRGTADDVKSQQMEYLAFFSKGKKVLDLGCGRGEFIELLADNGIEADGVDINEQMIEICFEKGLNCKKADILETLAGYDDGALGGIFSSQVIEHLPPPYLKRLIELAYFKLAPSSPIILETVNPTSVFALVQIYFLDLSHQRPIHPLALQFLMESAGFEEVEIKYSVPLDKERLHDLPSSDETATVLNRNIDKLNKLLYSPSNYAAIGVKK
jgi:O-antigen chain-terminating methyltransferase